jgi:hypothetical protein
MLHFIRYFPNIFWKKVKLASTFHFAIGTVALGRELSVRWLMNEYGYARTKNYFPAMQCQSNHTED